MSERVSHTLTSVPILRQFKLWQYCVNPFSAGTVCRHHILSANDGPHTERIKIFMMAVDQQMKRKELTKKFEMISN